MNSIIFAHFTAPSEGASAHDIAFHPLGAYIDAEIGSLEDLLDITGHEEAIDDIGALSGLHFAADASREDLGRLLEEERRRSSGFWSGCARSPSTVRSPAVAYVSVRISGSTSKNASRW